MEKNQYGEEDDKGRWSFTPYMTTPRSFGWHSLQTIFVTDLTHASAVEIAIA